MMETFLRTFLLFIFSSLFLCLPSWGKPKEPQSLENSFFSRAQRASFSATFQQEFYSALREKVSVTKGVLAIRAPSSFRFEIFQPQQELYVSNGIDFWKYVPSLNHAQHLSADSTEFDFIKIFTDLKSLKKYYHVTNWIDSKLSSGEGVLSDNPPAFQSGFHFLQLTPKMDRQQKVLYLVIDENGGFIKELRIVNANGNRTRLLFLDYDQKPQPASLFQFEPPQGIVIDQ